MAESTATIEMRDVAKRLRRRLEISGGTYGDRSDLRAGAEALERLADVIDRGMQILGSDLSSLGDYGRGRWNSAVEMLRAAEGAGQPTNHEIERQS